MLDYYGSFAGPTMFYRVKQLQEYYYAAGLHKHVMRQTTIDHMIVSISQGLSDYSYSGYSIFGRDEGNKLLCVRVASLDSNITRLVEATRANIMVLRTFRHWKQKTHDSLQIEVDDRRLEKSNKYNKRLKPKQNLANMICCF